MKFAYLALPAFLLTACGNSTPPQITQNTCEAVEVVITEGSKKNAFSAFRGEPVMLGDRELNHRWHANTNAFGDDCRTSIIRDMFGTDLYTYHCELYARTGSLEAEAREAEARAAIGEVRDLLSSCLGQDWVMKETSEHTDFEIYQKYLFEPKSGRPGADEFEFTADPIYIEMSYTPFSRGRSGPSGWLAKVQFQEMRKMN
ncbi:MAG: hypothetical protein CMK09_10905 [Ponticaulis sp.]|nr:hypothetical protein [Ponticaulis sp.]|tara:strand:- start:9169 stop:9771 length:603 start_codon:yes stop_codon:yes gene_type:complete